MKVTLTDELKIPDDKIKANQVQYNLDREVAKMLWRHTENVQVNHILPWVLALHYQLMIF